ncbi:ImmA/IrrE family metallo-endopeptidase [Bacillus altitudinis]|uniref:ImmA/IrrE family metallo-endopeptidase n=1 Tax=Bacillus altitudinis TaxID=293387 RepID=UPI002E1CAD66|nr:ImmA/IrrE family metallo-endopeptidase [Bacillus altitudinis]
MLNTYTQSHLEDWIERFLRGKQITSPSDLEIIELCRKMNIFIVQHEKRTCMTEICGVYVISIDSRSDPFQQRCELAHELWHILIEGGNNAVMPLQWKQYQEYKANYFSYHFCIPTFMLKNLNLPADQNKAALLVADIFKVTCEFAKRRLGLYYNKIKYH